MNAAAPHGTAPARRAENWRLRALAIRPYPDPLRSEVFGLLHRLGVHVHAPDELQSDPSNDDVIERLESFPADLLVIPFHVVRQRSGDRTTGLDLVRLLRQRPSSARVAVIMPVSLYAFVAFRAAWRHSAPANVFPLLEQEILEKATTSRLREFLISQFGDP